VHAGASLYCDLYSPMTDSSRRVIARLAAWQVCARRRGARKIYLCVMVDQATSLSFGPFLLLQNVSQSFNAALRFAQISPRA